METGVSIIICCYNSSSRIRPTLEHLAKQKNVSCDEWEIILVDNASTDNTTDAVKQIWQELVTQYSPKFTIVKEITPGLSHARNKGISQAYFKYVLFCDDDNWLEDNYLESALKIMETHPLIGILGGRGVPVFETEEPPYFWKNQYHALAVGKQSEDEGDITNSRGVVYGAGMVVNIIAYNRLLHDFNFQFQGMGRIGNSLNSSEDHELCLALKNIGYKIYVSNDMVFSHYIPKNRTTLDYYKRLFTGFGMSFPTLLGYFLNRDESNSFKNDYRYLCLRCLKNAFIAWIRLLFKGYNYKNISYMQSLYQNIGMIKSLLAAKNSFKKNWGNIPKVLN